MEEKTKKRTCCGCALIAIWVIILLLYVLSLGSCGVVRNKKIICKQYKEWVKAIGINDEKDLICEWYSVEENGIEIAVRGFESKTYDEFKKLIDNHNAFVEKNPNYFPEDFTIEFVFNSPGGDSRLFFSNSYKTFATNENSTFYVDLSSIETEKNHKMRYVYVYVHDLYNMIEMKTEFDVETIIFRMTYYEDGNNYYFDLSNYFSKYEKLVILTGSWSEDVNEKLERYKKANPGVEIYYKTSDEELKKYVPEEQE